MRGSEIKKGIYWVGAKDFNVRDFHGYKTNRGTTYNAYLILDEKITLVDTVKSTHTEEMLDRIKAIVDPAQIDIVISNHVEMDHSGALPEIMRLAPNATLITSTNGEKGLHEHYATEDWNIKVIKSGEAINIGKRNIHFVHTPMLHWPDSMVSYIPEEKLLLPNDAFGQHYAADHLFYDECPAGIVMEEAAKYYANIVYPFGAQVKKAIDAVSGLDIDMIAPSHGVIWRTELSTILDKYNQWANQENSNKAVVIYDSMWGSTEMMSKNIKAAFEDMDIPVVERCLKSSHISDIMTDILESKYVAIGSPVLNNQVLPTMGAFLTYIKGLKPKGKVGFAFGSYGWNRAAIGEIETVMGSLKWELPVPAISVKYRPKEEHLSEINEKLKTAIKELDND